MTINLSDLKGKVVLITGGTSGIGFSCAKLFCEYECKIVINSHDKLKLTKAKKELLLITKNVATMLADIRNINECKKLIDFTVNTFGKIDILINNAGIFEKKSFTDHSEDDFDKNFETLIKGPFFLSKYATPYFLSQKSGVIINMGSIWALQGIQQTPCSAYSAAKASIHAFTQTLSVELAPSNIRVLGIAPGLIRKNDNINHRSNFNPLGFDGIPSDISQLVVFLSSNNAKFMTGSMISVDGGFMAGRH